MADEWGPWIEHVPGPCPVPVGTYVQFHEAGKKSLETYKEGVVTEAIKNYPSWVMVSPYGPYTQVIRYRIRKPRALIELRELVETLPEKVGA